MHALDFTDDFSHERQMTADPQFIVLTYLAQPEAGTFALWTFQFDTCSLTFRTKDTRLTCELSLGSKAIVSIACWTRLDVGMYSFAALQFSTTRARCIPRFGFAEHYPLDQAGTVENMKNLHDS